MRGSGVGSGSPGASICSERLQRNRPAVTRPAPGGAQSIRPVPAPAAGLRPDPDPESGVTYEANPGVLEHARRENRAQPNLPWDA